MHLDILKFVRSDKNVYKPLETCHSIEAFTLLEFCAA